MRFQDNRISIKIQKYVRHIHLFVLWKQDFLEFLEVLQKLKKTGDSYY